MALPPTIPTSFVPKQPVTPTARKRISGGNPFLLLSYFILGLAVLGAAGVFGYQYYLQGVAKKKSNDVLVAQSKIDQGSVSEFIRLRDRFSASKDILNHQVALSQFFDVLEQNTIQNVSYGSLKLSVADDRHADIELSGTAKSFNALAAESTTLASEKRIKRAIFSGITTSPTSLVTFKLTAQLDPSLVERSAAAAHAAPAASGPQSQPLATTTQPAAQKPASGATASTTKP